MDHGSGSSRRQGTLPAKDRSIAAARFVSKQSHATEYRIAGNPGLVLVVMQPKGIEQSVRVWRCYYSVTREGRRHRRKVRLGGYPSTSLADARAAAAGIMAEVDRGGDPFVDRKRAAIVNSTGPPSRSPIWLRTTWASAASCFCRRDRAAVAQGAVPVLGKKRPAEITPADIDRLAATLLEPGRNTKVMARRLISRLKALFSYALLDAPSLGEKYGLDRAIPLPVRGRPRPGIEGRFGKPKPRTRVLVDEESVRSGRRSKPVAYAKPRSSHSSWDL